METNKPKRGRPKGDEPGKALTTLRIEPTRKNKCTYIAWYKRKTMTYIVESALDREIAAFEKANGVITDDQIKQVTDEKE